MSSGSNPFDEIERMFDRLSKQFEGLDPVDLGVGQHFSIDLYDEGDQFVVIADLAGYEGDDIEVTVSEERTLRVSAERETGTGIDEDGIAVRSERNESIQRTLHLSEPVDEDATTASHENGVLRVTLPKQGASEGDGQSIPVE